MATTQPTIWKSIFLTISHPLATTRSKKVLRSQGAEALGRSDTFSRWHSVDSALVLACPFIFHARRRTRRFRLTVQRKMRDDTDSIFSPRRRCSSTRKINRPFFWRLRKRGREGRRDAPGIPSLSAKELLISGDGGPERARGIRTYQLRPPKTSPNLFSVTIRAVRKRFKWAWRWSKRLLVGASGGDVSVNQSGCYLKTSRPRRDRSMAELLIKT